MNKGFARIPHQIYEEGLGVYPFAVFCALQHYTDRQGICYPSQERIANELKISRPTVNAAVKKLVKHNIISISKSLRGASGKWKSNTYQILNQSHWKTNRVNLINTGVKTTTHPRQGDLHHPGNHVYMNKNQVEQDALVKKNRNPALIHAEKKQVWETTNEQVLKESSKLKRELKVVNGLPQFVVKDNPKGGG